MNYGGAVFAPGAGLWQHDDALRSDPIRESEAAFRGVARHGMTQIWALAIGGRDRDQFQASNIQLLEATIMPKLRYGHAPGHVRETFGNAVEAFMAWKGGEPEPTVKYEIHYVPRQIPISRACGLVWNCTDIMPGDVFDHLNTELDGAIKRQAYAACARAMLVSIRKSIG
jgi:hypothetical protein